MERKQAFRTLLSLLLILAGVTTLCGCPAPNNGGGTTTPTPEKPGDNPGENTGGNPEDPTPTPTTASTIGDVFVGEFFVLYKGAGLESVAASLAADLSALTAREVGYGTRSRNANKIVLTADSDANAETVGDTAHMKLEGTELTISADNRNTLSLAVSAFLADVRESKNVVAGTDADIPLPTTFYKAADQSLFKYCGYWMPTDPEHPDSMTSYWNIAYVEIAFSGNVITVNFDKAASFEARIDKGEYVAYSGKTEQTFFAEGSGTHVLRIYHNYNSSQIKNIPFAGVTAGADVLVSRAPNKEHYIQFVGSSTLDTPTSFASQLADALDYDFCMTARAGVALQSNKSFWGVDSPIHYALLGKQNLSMADLFYKLCLPDNLMPIPAETRTMLFHAIRAGYTPDDTTNVSSLYIGNNHMNNPAHGYQAYRNSLSEADKAKLDAMVATIRAGGEPEELTALKTEYADIIHEYLNGTAYNMDFDYMAYKPDVIWTYLGANDAINSSVPGSDETFISAYMDFVEETKALYGEDTNICVMNIMNVATGGDTLCRDTLDRLAVMLKEKYDNKTIYAIDSVTMKEIAASMTFPDGLHANAESHKILAEKLVPIVQDFFD